MVSALTVRQFRKTMDELYVRKVLPERLVWSRVKGYRDEGNGLPIRFSLTSGRFILWHSFDLGPQKARWPYTWEIDGAMNCIVGPAAAARRVPIALVYPYSKFESGLRTCMISPRHTTREIILDVTDGILSDDKKLFVDFLDSLMGRSRSSVGVRMY